MSTIQDIFPPSAAASLRPAVSATPGRLEDWPESAHAEVWRRNLGAAIIGVAATPDATLVAAASIDRRVALFSAAGELLWQRTLGNEAWAVAISDDASRIAVGTAAKQPAAGAIAVFDRAGELLWQLEVDAPVWSVALSGDGRRLAAGCWNNQAYVFEAADGRFEERARKRLGEAGVYGVAMSAYGDRILAAAYDQSVVLLDGGMTALSEYASGSGAYHTALSRDGSRGVAGLRDGRAMLLRPHAEEPVLYTEVISQRPICGAAVSAQGLAALGSFDGRAYLVNGEGRLLWSLDAGGEVWATAVSTDGALVVVGSGDGTLRLVRNRVDDAANASLLWLEHTVERAGEGAPALAAAQRAVAAFRRLGLIDYAVRRLQDWGPRIGREAASELARRLLLDDTAAFPRHHQSHFLLATMFEAQGEYRQAAWHYIWAGQDDRLRLDGLTRAGEAFSRAGLGFAAKSAFRRAHEQRVGEEAKRTLYSMGRAFEDNGQLAEARKYYEVVFTFSPDYRDVFARLEQLGTPEAAAAAEAELNDANEAAESTAPAKSAVPADWYDSLLLGLLGPDVPRLAEVDQSLHPILRARSKELAVSAEDRKRMLSVIAEHALERDAPGRQAGLDYDEAVYMRYDASVPEDETKKSLELIHVLDCIKRYGPFQRSLDIGAATGRYPTLFSGMGIEAFGVDIEPEAVAFALKKRGDAPYPDFRVGDARALPFEDASFNLVTCMMGTAAHIPAGDMATVLAEIHRCLRPGGAFILSTWDVECPHLTFLSIYSHAQKEEMRRNSPTRGEVRAMALAQGFTVDELRPVGLMPESITYELDLQQFGPNRIGHLVDLDLAFRALFPALHGQMYVMLVRKPA
ncbi:methyltransferase domain-containing protein [Chitinimonas koreensis]|uniref:methyltransferase domain-containing protein n=1 Tax=Chitinimonas koreensis TaxID=356302 RepID=UPI00041A4CBE|nr:methyltransferase domain-containing protein [Chitinimonas koreensis]QNM96269.1 methyltransferase domain-containing protein [Chitinimonas koreensis]